jgi:hypothetical protein
MLRYVNIFKVKIYSVTKTFSNPWLIGMYRYVFGYSKLGFGWECGMSSHIFSWSDLRPEKGLEFHIESDAG